MAFKDEFDRLNTEFTLLAQRRQPEALSVFASIERRLEQFNLSGAYDVRDILHETYLRAYKYLSTGHKIHNVLAWVRHTSFNVIYEHSRRHTAAQKRHRSLDDRLIESAAALVTTDPDPLFPDTEQESYVYKIQQAWYKLSERDRELLQLRIVENKSWAEIAVCVATLDQGQTVEAMRKRGSRALQRFRNLYRSI